MRSRKDLWRDHLLMFLVKWGIGYTTFLKLSHCLVKMPTLNRMCWTDNCRYIRAPRLAMTEAAYLIFIDRLHLH